ncbi:glycosyltransferase [Nesterenkonia sp. HG001]|uniref:glycosyltransferase family 4 protein n=1 Tax=Nesterenkonia sp. HG001 TaxID=2983207 RepID=UPI002AC700F3|nr:glycosyltransferase [Nesterenkonia sp. HG001]MDZ5078673.1 glycosyltransferase [Nesterenkonia sp. HG001]
MRIAYLLADPGIGVFGTKGASVHVQEMVRALRSHNHEVTVYCTKRGDRPGRPETESVPDDLADLPVVVVPVPGARDAAAREAAVAQAAARMARRAAADGAEAAYERYSLFSEAGARLVELTGVPLAVEVNAPLIEEQRDHRTLHDETTAWSATRRTFAAADVVSCVSEPVARWVARVEPSAQVAVIPNGVNTERIRPQAEDQAGQATRPFTIGFVGTLKPWHGTEMLLRAVATASGREPGGWRLEICGYGPELARLRALAEELGLEDTVHFLGAVPPARIPQILEGFDVAVAPYPRPASGEHYFSPLKVYEYLAAQVAVVASAVGDLPEVLGHGSCGLLVSPGDVDALANALDQLARHPELRARLAAAGRAAVVAEHSWHRRCAQLLTMLGHRSQAVIPG